MYCLIAGPWRSPEPPPALPYTTCHSTADSFIYFLTIPILLSLSGYTATFPCSFFYVHFYLLCRFPPKFHSPIICAFPFLCSITLPANTSLSLISFPYSLSHLSFPLIFPLFAASLHRLLPFANLHFFYLFFSFHWPQSSPALCHCQVMLIPKRWEDVVECMWRISPLF